MQIARNVLLAILPLALGACAVADPGPVVLPGNVNAPPPQMDVAGDALLTNTIWTWQGTLLPGNKSIGPDYPERYAIEFQPGGMVNVRADCNRGRGSYLLNGAQLSFGAIAMSKMLCQQGSRDSEFLGQLAAVAAQSFQGNDLMLTLAGNGGTMKFASTPQ